VPTAAASAHARGRRREAGAPARGRLTCGATPAGEPAAATADRWRLGRVERLSLTGAGQPGLILVGVEVWHV
jgi:hypothetical protein